MELFKFGTETSRMVSSFDLQSQVKHISISKVSSTSGCYVLASTTKSGPIAFLQFTIV